MLFKKNGMNLGILFITKFELKKNLTYYNEIKINYNIIYYINYNFKI